MNGVERVVAVLLKIVRFPAVLFLIVTATALRSAATDIPGTWRIVPSPNVGHGGLGNGLLAVAVISPMDVWATGFFPKSGTGPPQALIEHWNGVRWVIVPSPIPSGSSYSSLNSITAISANDIWAVGFAGFPPHTPERHTLTEHWNGAGWRIVPSPNPGNQKNELFGVSAVSRNDVWAVGDAFSGASGQMGGGLTLHWDGVCWRPIPNPANASTLFGTTALGTTDVWAVGTTNLHWNGARWSRVPFQMPPSPGNTATFLSVTGASLTDIWTAGFYLFPTPEGSFPAALIEHFNGSSFRIAPSPGGSDFFGIKALAANDIWAVGLSGTSTPLVEHWNGSAWSVDTNPAPGSFSGFAAVDGHTSSDLWAVGAFNPGFGSDITLTEHHTIP